MGIDQVDAVSNYSGRMPAVYEVVDEAMTPSTEIDGSGFGNVLPLGPVALTWWLVPAILVFNQSV